MRQRREPELGVLFRCVQAEWNAFVQRAEAGERGVPRFCRREVGHGLRSLTGATPSPCVIGWPDPDGVFVPRV